MKLRQDQMTSEERLEALFNYQTPDRVPIGIISPLEFAALNSGYPRIVNYTDIEKSFYSQILTAEQYGWDKIPIHVYSAIHGGLDFGGKGRLPESDYQQGIAVLSYPVNSEEDVAKMKLPDRKTAGRIPLAMEFARLQEKHGLPIWFCGRSPVATAADICGVNLLCRWMIKKPELCHELIQWALKHYLNVVEDWANIFGADRIIAYYASATESNEVISPKQFETFALPYHIQLHERLKAIGVRRFMAHICGDQRMNLPIMAEASPWQHPSILSFGHEIGGLDIAAKYFPEDIIFGDIYPVLLQTGTHQEVYEACRHTIEKGKKAPGGFILGPGCSIPAAIPPANMFAMTRAVNDFGWYK